MGLNPHGIETTLDCTQMGLDPHGIKPVWNWSYMELNSYEIGTMHIGFDKYVIGAIWD